MCEEITHGGEGSFPALRPLETLNTGKSAERPKTPFSRESVAEVMRLQGRGKEALRYLNCGKMIKDYCLACDYVKPEIRVYRCGLRECRECSQIETNRLFNRVLQEMFKMPHIAGWAWRHIVLTSKRENKFTLKHDYSLVKFGLDRLQNYFRTKKFKAKIGAVGGIEFGPQNQMVHVHLLIYCPFLDKEEMLKKWKLGSIFYKKVTSEKQALNACLYAVDFSKLKDPAILANIGYVMKRTRRVFTWGRLYGSAKKEKKKKDGYKCPKCKEGLHWRFNQEGDPRETRAGPIVDMIFS